MRTEEEVHDMFHNFDAGEEGWLEDCRGDNFKYGMWVGKMIALEWVLGGPLANLKIQYDFESWEIECTEQR